MERLVITTKTWKLGNIRSCCKSLEPREGDDGKKSSWSCINHVISEPEKIVPNAESVVWCQCVHALNSLIHKLKGQLIVSEVTGVSLLRKAIAIYVIDDEGDHVVLSCCPAHRSIRSDTQDIRLKIVEAVSNAGDAIKWRYTTEELVPLLSRLVSQNAIQRQYDPQVQTVLKDTPPVSEN